MAKKMTAAESAAYARGYRAGKAAGELTAAQKLSDEIYLRLIPIAIEAQGWSLGGKPVASGEQRIDLAASWTRLAMLRRPIR